METKELEDLKLKYGKIKVLTVIVEPEVKDAEGVVTTPAEKYEFAIRRPDRGHIKMLLPLAEKKEIEEFADKAVKNLVVGGDTDALEDGIVYMGVVSQLKGMISPAESFLANA
jgi:PHP family Zn ribbon phosphoesterase